MTYTAALNLARMLQAQEEFDESEKLLGEILPGARVALGDDDGLFLSMRRVYAESMGLNCSASRRDDLAEAVAILEDVSQRGRRVFGPDHPEHRGAPNMLECARNKLASVDKRLATCAKFGVHCPDCNYDDSDSLDDC